MQYIKLFLLSLAFIIPGADVVSAQQAVPQEQQQASAAGPEARFRAFQQGIQKGDPAQAKKFLADQDALAFDTANNRSMLRAQSMALADLFTAMNKDWKAEQINEIYKILLNRIGPDKVLTQAGVGPQPEKLLPWLVKYVPEHYAENEIVQDSNNNPQYSAKTVNVLIVQKAIRNWEALFGNAQSRSYEWDGIPLTATKAQWDDMTLLNRNATLKKIAAHLARLGDSQYLFYDEEFVEAVKVQRDQVLSVQQAIQSNILTQEQKKQLEEAQTPADKAYLLNKFFDGSNVKYTDEIRMSVNSRRDSAPEETFSAQSRQLMSSMLQSSIASELKGTAAGDRILKNGLKVEIAYCDSGYSEIKEDGTIVLDEETIQQYMRLKGYTSEAVLSDKKKVSEIAKYMSPAVVYEASHADQSKWAKANGAYKTNTQEDEIDAMSAEAYYMAEKLKNDETFYNTFTGVEKYSKYAAKRMENATSYSQGKKMFADNVRSGCQELPTISSARANLINVINEELARRSALAPEEREMEYGFITYDEAAFMSPDQIRSSVRDIEEGALAKLLSSLNSDAYSQYNRDSVSKTRTDYNEMMASGKKSAGSGAIPLPGTAK